MDIKNKKKKKIDSDISDKVKQSILNSPNFRIPLSLSLVVLFHRFLHRFFIKLRASLRTDAAKSFRERNPRISKALTSRFAPAVGASFAGFAFGICPQAQMRVSVAIFTATKSLEFLYNVADEKGWSQDCPSWFGSWLLMPVSLAQLFHAFVYDRETTPSVSWTARQAIFFFFFFVLRKYSDSKPVVWTNSSKNFPKLYTKGTRVFPWRLAG